MSHMRFKTFTQAYFLIKNNKTFTKSLGDRAENVVFWVSLIAVFAAHTIKPKLPANDKI